MKHLLVYAVVLSTAGGCQFGSLPSCVYQCHCENGNPCDPVTGACPDGCDDGDPDGYFSRGAWGGPGCQEGNVAFGQPATVRGGYGLGEPWRAVDGDRTSSRSSDDACFELHSHDDYDIEDEPVIWQVDLGRTHVVNNITIYGEDGFNFWVDGVVEVGDRGIFEQCGSLRSYSLMVQVICPSPLLGRYVSINIRYYHEIFLCEVYVNGYHFVECSSGVFGPGCLTECHCHTNCDVISGECSSNCEDGWLEYNCQAPCGAGTWGPNCSHTCYCINQSEACHHIDGSCKVSGCALGHLGLGCDAGESMVSSGAIAGGVVAVLLVVALVIIVLFLRRHYYKRDVSPGENGAGVVVTMPASSLTEVDSGSLDLTVSTIDPAEWVVVRGTPHLHETREPLTRPIRVQELGDTIQDTKSQTNGFQSEFMQIPSGQTASWSIAERTINMGKNRFNNIMAYDHSRVKLDVSTQDQDQDYINANFVPAYGNGGKGYIAAQGPRVHTIIDTWRMVWQYQVNRIVMLTTIMEEEKAKCEYYWPKTTYSEAQEYGEFKVRLIKEDTFADYVVRTLSVTYKEETRSVTQFHYLSWPNHGMPQSAASLLNFRRKVRLQDDTATGPLVVHCSGGVGRTGVFIVLDYSLDQAMNEKAVDVLKNVCLVRSYRINMVANVAQYTFVYEALLHALQRDSTAIPTADMARVFPDLLIPDPETNQSPLATQFEFLNNTTTPISDKLLEGMKPENIYKNRNRAVIPRDESLPFLSPHRDAGSDYINATYINGYRRLYAYIVTQMPLPQTICDFWRMVYDHKSTSIVLTYDVDPSQPEDETCPPYWPTDVNGVFDLDFLEVETESEEKITDCIIVRQIRITSTTEEEEKVHTVRQFHLLGWLDTATTPSNPDHLLALLDALEQWQRQSGNDVITVQCKNGVHQSGLVCAVSFLLEKLKVDQEIDPFLAVAQMRLARPQLIDSFEQYVFLHEIALKYMERYDMYANFKRVT